MEEIPNFLKLLKIVKMVLIDVYVVVNLAPFRKV